MHRIGGEHTLIAVNLVTRALRALLPLGLFGFWLLPSVQTAEAAPAVRAVHDAAPAVGLRAAPLVIPGSDLAPEVELPQPRHPGHLPVAAPLAERAPHVTSALDPSTRSRSRAPIYRVRRSGQAHRSAP